MKQKITDLAANLIAKRIVKILIVAAFNVFGIVSVVGIPIVTIVDILFILILVQNIYQKSKFGVIHVTAASVKLGKALWAIIKWIMIVSLLFAGAEAIYVTFFHKQNDTQSIEQYNQANNSPEIKASLSTVNEDTSITEKTEIEEQNQPQTDELIDQHNGIMNKRENNQSNKQDSSISDNVEPRKEADLSIQETNLNFSKGDYCTEYSGDLSRSRLFNLYLGANQEITLKTNNAQVMSVIDAEMSELQPFTEEDGSLNFTTSNKGKYKILMKGDKTSDFEICAY